MTVKPTLSIAALKACVPEGAATSLSLVVTIDCPPRAESEAAARPPLNLALAIDRSGSMNGKPIEEAKRCAARVIQALQPGDRVSVVAYDNQVVIPVPAAEAGTNRSSMLAAVAGIQARGSTNLHAGWLASAGEAAQGIQAGTVTRVLLLSDGQANDGVQDIAEISRQASALADKGVATSTVGLGLHFNEDLMTALARAGGGQSSYGETVDDLWPSFEAELGLLQATCGREAVLRLVSPCGGKIRVSGLRAVGEGAWRLPDLVHGAQSAVLVDIAVEELASGQCAVLEASISWKGMDGKAEGPLEGVLSLPSAPFADFVLSPSDPAVATRVLEAEAALLQEQAKAAARARDFATVESIADKMTVMAPGNAWIGGMADTLRSLSAQGDAVLISKEATYALDKLGSTSYTASAAITGNVLPEYLRRRTRQGDSASAS